MRPLKMIPRSPLKGLSGQVKNVCRREPDLKKRRTADAILMNFTPVIISTNSPIGLGVKMLFDRLWGSGVYSPLSAGMIWIS